MPTDKLIAELPPLGSDPLAPDDVVAVTDVSDTSSAPAGTTKKIRPLTVFPMAPGGRLTNVQGNPTPPPAGPGPLLYYEPYAHNQITLWDGADWVTVPFAPTQLQVTSTFGNYDVYAYLSAGSMALEHVKWDTDATRGSTNAIQIFDGRYCRSSDKTRLLLGTVKSETTGLWGDNTVNKRYIWNMYNRVLLNMYTLEPTDTWNWSGDWRERNGSAANRVFFIRGIDEDAMVAVNYGSVSIYGGMSAGHGVGLGGATLAVGCLSDIAYNNLLTYASVIPLHGRWSGLPGIGWRYLTPIERSSNGTTIFVGDGAVPGVIQSGFQVEGWF